MSVTIFIYAHWAAEPLLVGELKSDLVRGAEHFSFNYDETWLKSKTNRQIDPELKLYEGIQHSSDNKNFSAFLDSCPDRWGRLLMTRREALLAKKENRKPRKLNESDFLIGVHDQYRMGALRFKKVLNGPFLDNNNRFAAPPISSLNELVIAKEKIEEDTCSEDDYLKWLSMLMAPGSSLGGARPKASVIDEKGALWIAKFPSKLDEYNIGAWEFVAYQLAINAGILMAPSKIINFGKSHHTFLTKRFDRNENNRLHFSSALTQLGYYDGEYQSSYLEIAQFLIKNGANSKKDLEQLFRRVVFNIAVSNVDDHLRNHGFILGEKGWCLSPAFDINPITPAHGLTLNISDEDNRLDFNLAISVAEFFKLKDSEAKQIVANVKTVVQSWHKLAKNIGLTNNEMERMSSAFNV